MIIFQGMLFASSKNILTSQDLIRLYIHEAERTYSDKLINQEDLELFNKILRETIRKNFEVGSFEIRMNKIEFF
jgi:dynein heavy chain